MSVEKKSAQASASDDDLGLIAALWGGTKAMREAGAKYNPMAALEKDKDYSARLERSVLTNFTRKTIKSYAGKVCEDEIKVIDDDNAAVLAENVDREGRDIHRFAYSIVQSALRDGLSFILVDAPKSTGISSLAEERAAGIRPYWIEVDRRNILGWRQSEGRLLQVRIMESVSEDAGEFSESEVEQIRVIEPGSIRLYRKTDKGDWVLHDDFQTSFDFVPLVPVFVQQKAFFQADPPFMDLAYLNIDHWQKNSDQSNILHTARVPILFGAGIKAPIGDDGVPKDIVVGPHSFVSTPEPSGTLRYVEHTGAAISAGREDLLDIENRARAVGADFATSKPGVMTATERALDEAGANSELSAFAINLKDSLELAMSYSMRMQGKEFVGRVTVNTDYGISSNGLTPDTLRQMRLDRVISQKTFLRLINEITGFEIDYDSEMEMLSDEKPGEFEGAGLGTASTV